MNLPEAYEQAHALGNFLIACDVSPPRGAGWSEQELEELAGLGQADFLCCAYLPGRSVRMPAQVCAALLQQKLGVPAIFNLAPRDMNRLALSSLLLGASALGLGHGLVLHGDELSDKDLGRGVRSVRDTTATGLLRLAAELRQGKDFRGLGLSLPAPLCMGATLDPEAEGQWGLAQKKIEAGAAFLITQTLLRADPVAHFCQLPVPILWGIPVLSPDGMVLGELPGPWKEDLKRGRAGEEIALEFIQQLGVVGLYLVAPILKGGLRDYGAVARLLRRLRG